MSWQKMPPDKAPVPSGSAWRGLLRAGSVSICFGLVFGFSTAIIAGVLDDVAKAYALGTAATETMVAALVFSAFLGAIAASPVTSYLGRRAGLGLASLLVLGGYTVILFEPDARLFMAARIAIGFAVGLSSMAAPMYAGEASPTRYRGAIVSMFQLAVTLGILAAYALPLFFFGTLAWFQIIGTGVVIGGAALVVTLVVPESPRWLLARGKPVQAKKAARVLGLSAVDLPSAPKRPRTAGPRTLFQGAIPMVLVLCGSLFVLQNLSGIDAFLYYAPRVFEGLGFDKGVAALTATFALGAINVVSTLIAIRLMDRLGRRPLIVVGSAVMTLGLLSVVGAQVTGSATLGLVGLCIYIAAFAASLGPIPYVMMSELFPTRIREPGIAAASATSWLFNGGVAFFFLSAVESFGTVTVFLFFAGICFLSLIIGILFVPETKGVPLEDIEENVLQGIGLRDLGTHRRTFAPQKV
ncbi:MAG: sugar porter family MFS transporter [Rhodobacteraceae bacterium]|nr:sugar porter family MFS transporter [Paracoccaceae bacterium]